MLLVASPLGIFVGQRNDSSCVSILQLSFHGYSFALTAFRQVLGQRNVAAVRLDVPFFIES